MARENTVLLFGQVSAIRISIDSNTGEPTSARMVLRVTRRTYATSDMRLKGSQRQDEPLVYSRNKAVITHGYNGIKANDMVLVFGCICSKDQPRKFVCSSCGQAQYKELSVITYVDPIFVSKFTGNDAGKLVSMIKQAGQNEIDDFIRDVRSMPIQDGVNAFHSIIRYSEEEGQKKVDASYEISNRVIVLGRVCREITDNDYYHDPERGDDDVRYDRLQFEMAINRPRRILEDAPDDTTDFIWVRAYGKEAAELKAAIHKGSTLLINGAIQTRISDTMFKHTCKYCGQLNVKRGMATEIVPYRHEYIDDCNVPDDHVDSLDAEDTAERYIPDV